MDEHHSMTTTGFVLLQYAVTYEVWDNGEYSIKGIRDENGDKVNVDSMRDVLSKSLDFKQDVSAAKTELKVALERTKNNYD